MENRRIFCGICLALICTFSLLSYIYSTDVSDVELSERMRGYPVAAKVGSHTTKHATDPTHPSLELSRVLGKANSVLDDANHYLQSEDDDAPSSPHSKEPMSNQGIKAGSQTHPALHESTEWKTEQAMKNELDVETAKKSGQLWKSTVNIVHSTDPNERIISKLTHAGEKQVKSSALKRVSQKSNSMDFRLKAELDSKTRNAMGQMEQKDVELQKAGLHQMAKRSKVAQTAAAHKNMPLSDMKKMLANQLDDSVKGVVTSAKKLEKAGTDTQLESRLKAELDAKAKAEEKRMMRRPDEVKRSLQAARHKLHGRLDRAAKVRLQLSKEMKEEDAIRKQLDMQAERAGKRMLNHDIQHESSGTKSNPLESEVKSQLESKESTKKGSHQLEDFLRNQLDDSDRSKRKRLYIHAVQRKLLDRLGKRSSTLQQSEPNGHNLAAKETAALMKETLKQAGNHEPFADLHRHEATAKQRAAAPRPMDVHSATAALLKSALQRSTGLRPFADLHRAEAMASHRAAQHPVTSEHDALVRVMETSLRRARGVTPFAAQHKLAAAEVRDMAAANRRSTLRAGGLARGGKLGKLVLGHYRELQDADRTAESIRRARVRTVHEAESEEQEAVE